MTSSTIKLTKAPGCGSKTHAGYADKENQDRQIKFRIGHGEADDWATAPAESLYALAVADGVTSQAAGATASEIAVRVLKEQLQKSSDSGVPRQLATAFHAANSAILSAADSEPTASGMSTTLVAAVIDQDKLYVTHVGDSRAYLIRDKEIYCLTVDHSWIQDAIDAGRFANDPSAAKTHTNRNNLTKHLGMRTGFIVDQNIIQPGTGDSKETRRLVSSIKLQEGDVVLLCSDGLNDKVSDKEIYTIVASSRDQPQSAAIRLVKKALEKRETDNITCSLIVMPRSGVLTALPSLQGLSSSIALFLVALLVGATVFLLYQTGRLASLIPLPTQSATSAMGVQPATETDVLATSEASIIQESVPSEESSTDAAGQTDITIASASELTPTISSSTETVDPQTTALVSDLQPSSTTTSTVATPAVDSIFNQTASDGAAAVASTAAPYVAATQSEVSPTATSATNQAIVNTSTQTPSSPAVRPTSTRVPTSNRIPTNTPTTVPTSTNTSFPTPTLRPTTVSSTPTFTPLPPTTAPSSLANASTQSVNSASSQSGVKRSVTLLEPPDGDSSSNDMQFSWKANFDLGPNEAFELIFWEKGGDPMVNGLGLAGSSRESSAKVGKSIAKGHFPLNQALYWGIRLVQKEPYQKIEFLGSKREFTFTESSSTTGRDGR